MRIIAGEWKGRRLLAPLKGDLTIRPTSDRVRESMFNLLVHRGLDFEGATGWDLFAGTGALGLEAVSRGARSVIWVEENRRAGELIRDNLKHLQMEKRGTLVSVGVERFLQKQIFARHAEVLPVRFVFVDPPYAFTGTQKILENLAQLAGKKGIFEPHAWIIFEASSKDATHGENLSMPGFGYIANRRYGGTQVHFWKRSDT